MALRFMESYDNYVNSDVALSSGTSKWNTFVNTSGTIVPGRFINSWRSAPGQQCYMIKTLDNQPTWVVGFAFKMNNEFYNGQPILGIYDVSTIQVYLSVNGSGNLILSRASTVLSGGTSTNALTLGTWYYIELYITISSSIPANGCNLNVNGTNWITVATGQSTQNT